MTKLPAGMLSKVPEVAGGPPLLRGMAQRSLRNSSVAVEQDQWDTALAAFAGGTGIGVGIAGVPQPIDLAHYFDLASFDPMILHSSSLLVR
jgi:hypothetical protein